MSPMTYGPMKEKWKRNVLGMRIGQGGGREQMCCAGSDILFGEIVARL